MRTRPAPPAGLVQAAWLDLLQATTADPPPCAMDPDAWTSDEPDLDAAAYGCLRCHAFTHCGRYADLADERYGIWAAVDRNRQKGRRSNRRLLADPIDHDHQERA